MNTSQAINRRQALKLIAAGERPHSRTGGGCRHACGSPNWNVPKNWREVLALTGEATSAGSITEKKRHHFEPPADGDWVLVLDDKAKNFPRPRTSVDRRK